MYDIKSDPEATQTPSAEPFQRLDLCAPYPYTAREYARRFLWEWVQCTLILLSPRRAFAWRRFWLRLFGATMTPTSNTYRTTKIFHPWLLTMADHSCISGGVTVYNLGPVSIGRHTVLSQDVYVCAGTHDYTQPHLPLQRSAITIGDGVWVCAGAFIGPGVTIGNNSVVGARAVVVKDIPPGVVAAGNPARPIKPRPMRSPQ